MGQDATPASRGAFATIDALVRVRSGLALSVLAYLTAAIDVAASLPEYFPERLRKRGADFVGFDLVYQTPSVVQAGEHGPLVRPFGLPDVVSRGFDLGTDLGAPVAAPPSAVQGTSPGTRSILRGGPGSGKSWCLRHRLLCIARAAWAQVNASAVPIENVHLPILLSWSDLGIRVNGNSLEDALTGYVLDFTRDAVAARKDVRVARGGSFESWVRQRFEVGACTLLLDDWGEAQYLHADLEARFNVFVGRFPRVSVLATARDDSDVTILPVPNAETLRLAPLDDSAASAFGRAWFSAPSELVAPSSRDAVAALDAALSRDPSLRDLAGNPQMLTWLCRLIEEQPSSEYWRSSAPSSRAFVFDSIVRGLLWHWKTTVGKAETVARVRAVSGAVVDGSDYTEAMIDVLARVARRLFDQPVPYRAAHVRAVIEQAQNALPQGHPFAPSRVSWSDLLAHIKCDGLVLAVGKAFDADLMFLHRTLLDYLAAVGLAAPAFAVLNDHQSESDAGASLAAALAPRLAAQGWRNVAALVFGYVIHVQRHTERSRAFNVASAALEGLLGTRVDCEQLILLGDAVANADSGAFAGKAVVQLRSELKAAMRVPERNAPRIRVAAGRTLARLGDDRFAIEGCRLPQDDTWGFLWIPAGAFSMGSSDRDKEAAENEGPQHSMWIDAYAIAKWPTTVAQFGAYREATDSRRESVAQFDGTSSDPVVRVSWHEAIAYCRWVTDELRKACSGRAPEESGPPKFIKSLLQEGWIVSLPSEAEWERAARGDYGQTYPWSHVSDGFDQDRVNCCDDASTAIRSTSPVGCYRDGASPFGVEEAAGNVWEWTRSAYRDVFESRALHRDEGAPRTIRGGSFGSHRRFVRAACRDRLDPSLRGLDVGFRVALVAPEVHDGDPHS